MIPRNSIFRSVDEENGRFEVRGEPNFREQTSTWITQDIKFSYNGVAEHGINLWAGTGVNAYDPENDYGFLPFGFKAEVIERLPLNYTFQNVKYLPDGS